METYRQRKTDYRKAHGFSNKSLEKLAESLELKDDSKFLDLMAGKGTVSNAVVSYYSARGIRVHPILQDKYLEQLPESLVYPINVSDVRNIELPNESFDGAGVKLGLHEIPKFDQYFAFCEVSRILKPGAFFSLWELALEDVEIQTTYSQIVRKKDSLAGFDDLVRNRHFMRQEQIFELLARTGFENVEVYHPCTFTLDSGNYILGNNLSYEILEEFNAHIRSVVPERLKERINYQDFGDTISMKFNQPIIRGRKK